MLHIIIDVPKARSIETTRAQWNGICQKLCQ